MAQIDLKSCRLQAMQGTRIFKLNQTMTLYLAIWPIRYSDPPACTEQFIGLLETHPQIFEREGRQSRAVKTHLFKEVSHTPSCLAASFSGSEKNSSRRVLASTTGGRGWESKALVFRMICTCIL